MFSFDFSQINKVLLSKLVFLHIFIITVSNYLVQFGHEFLGIKFTWGMFTFPLIVVLTDLTVRLTSQNIARSVVFLAFFPAFFISTWITNPLIGIASAAAYLVGQTIDIFVFQKIREKTDLWWVAPALSTIVANTIDTYLFFFVAFSSSSDKFMASNWLEIAHTDLMFKVVVSVLIFLPLYGVLLSYLQKRILNN